MNIFLKPRPMKTYPVRHEIEQYINMADDQEMFDTCIQNMQRLKREKENMDSLNQSVHSTGSKSSGFKLFNSKK